MSFLTLDDLIDRAVTRLTPLDGPETLGAVGDADLASLSERPMRDAAVLIPVIPRDAGPTVLLTTRPDTMAAHPGQVAFPGGKVEPEDRDPVAAALRETEEEIGVPRQNIEPIARSAPYLTGTAYRITPVLARLPADVTPVPDPEEVANIFEVPLSLLLAPDSFEHQHTHWQGRLRRYYQMYYSGHRIWGVTAGIVQDLRRKLYDPVTAEASGG